MSKAIPSGDLPDGNGLTVGIVAARFNEEMVNALMGRVVACLESVGAKVITSRVPGSWELPFAAQEQALTGEFQAIVALGVVVAGDTRHHEHIAITTGWGITEVSLKHRVPVLNGILVTETEQQAYDRTLGDNDKGYHFAKAALEIARYKPL